MISENYEDPPHVDAKSCLPEPAQTVEQYVASPPDLFSS